MISFANENAIRYGASVKRSPDKTKRPARKRDESAAQQGVASAQKVLAALLEKHDPPAFKKKR